MAMNSLEDGVVSTLQSAITLFKANLSTLIPDIYGYESAASQAEIQTWWQDNGEIVIRTGYTRGPIKGLSWNVSIGPEQEITARKTIGSNAYESNGIKTLMSSFDSTFIVGCLGTNQDWLRWSQMLCKWALLYYRKSLENQYGFQNQRISMGALQPVPNDLRDAVAFAWMRTVTLSAQHTDTWDELPEPTIQSATITLDPTY